MECRTAPSLLITQYLSTDHVGMSSDCFTLTLVAAKLLIWEESQLLLLQEADIGDTFFDALERVGSIHRSCRNLLSSHHHRAGLELMDAMSTYQETAYERLCRSLLPVICFCVCPMPSHASVLYCTLDCMSHASLMHTTISA